MSQLQRQCDAHTMEIYIGNLLRVGVILSAIIVSLGGALYLAKHGNQVANYKIFRGESTNLKDVYTIFQSSLALQGRDMIQIGLLVLVAMPVVRVAFSIIAFALQKDWLYVAITAVVLILLFFSLTSRLV